MEGVRRWFRGASAHQRIGGLLVAVLAVFAIIVPLFAGDPLAQDLDHTLVGPSLGDPLGTDHLGRSVLARLSNAARLSLSVALASVVTAALSGAAAGILAAWRGGWPERVLVAVADVVLAIPGLLLVILLTALAPGDSWPFYVGLSAALWVEQFRVVRAASRSLLAGPQVEASRLLGFGPVYIVRRHLVPELAPVLATLTIFGAATAVVSLATLGLVGLGVRPPTPELGRLIIETLPHYREAPWLVSAPVAVLAMTVVGLALVADREEPR
jgi:peptide/nickel transport system permease protein